LCLGNEVLFSDASSQELDNVLSEILHKIILPARLPPPQQKRVYQKSAKDSLKRDPVIIEVEGYEHRFEHIDKLGGDVPNSSKILFQALRLMETKADWDNLTRLLSGMNKAGRRWNSADHSKMIRLAGSKGQIYSIIEAARQVRRTNFKVDTPEQLSELLHWVQMKAVDSNWDADATAKALRWSEMVLEILQDSKHKSTPVTGQAPLHRDPQVLGAILHLAAARAVKHQEGKDVGGKVTEYAKAVVAQWPADKGLKSLYPEELNSDKKNGTWYLLQSRTQYLATAGPILSGLKLAMQVVEPSLAAQLKPIAATLEAEANGIVAQKDVRAARGEATWEKLFGGKA
jgi:hypothetical protein